VLYKLTLLTVYLLEIHGNVFSAGVLHALDPAGEPARDYPRSPSWI